MAELIREAMTWPKRCSSDEPRVLALMTEHRLGRKRILDTALAATLDAAGIRRLATYNVRDYACFSFLDPLRPGPALAS